jgi:predicted phosphohydrolase
MDSEFNPKHLSRRQALRKGAGAAALLACGAWHGALRAQGVATGEFRFVVANDLHYFDEKCIPFFQRVVKQIQATSSGVDFVLLAGDISDWGQGFHFAAVKDIFGVLKKPVHVVCGNHDWADWDDRKAFLDAYPNSLNYTFEHGGFQVIGLDSTDHNLMSVNVTRETLAWLDKNLPRIDKKRPLVVFTHFPLHPQLRWPARNSADVLARFWEHNLQAVFGGHCHAYRVAAAGHAAVVTNRCCSFAVRNHDRTTPEKGYFLCHAKDGKVRREFVAVEA